jgi:hypothetical protein
MLTNLLIARAMSNIGSLLSFVGKVRDGLDAFIESRENLVVDLRDTILDIEDEIEHVTTEARQASNLRAMLSKLDD